jgi:Beta-lactamase
LKLNKLHNCSRQSETLVTGAREKFESYDEQRLCEMLARAHTVRSGSEIFIGLLVGDMNYAVRMDSTGRVQPGTLDTARIPLSCAAKVLTGTLAVRIAGEARLDFDRDFTDLLRSPLPGLSPALDGVTIRHLLSHAHGLDASHIERIQRTDAGHIDLQALCRSLGESRRLFDPGAFYSYSDAGSWLTIALLESLYGTRFSQLLISRVLAPAGIEISEHDPDINSWCPATGGDLRLSGPEILQFLRWHLSEDTIRRHPQFDHPAAPPGWCFERGACGGWKYYGSGWYGHNMTAPHHSLVLRAHFEDRVAFVVTAAESSATLTVARLFGKLLPEYVSLGLPKPLAVPVLPPDAAGCAGTYARQSTIVRVKSAAENSLEAEIFTDWAAFDHNSPQIRSALRPGTANAYLAEPIAAPFFQWVQFVTPNGQHYLHLWDGRQVLRRIGF